MPQTRDRSAIGNVSEDGQRAASPPYVSFSTFRTLLEWLKDEGVPLRFDRSFWQIKFSGSNGTQLVTALRFLGLLEGVRPRPDLERLVNASPDERRFVLAGLLIDAYEAVPFDELSRATPAMVRTWFRAYPIDGNTARKAVSFFVNAAKDADIPLSNAVRKMARSKSSGHFGDRHATRRSAASQSIGDTVASGGVSALPSLHLGQSHNQSVIALESGGVITVDVDVDLFSLSDRDREFVMKLVGLTRAYPSGEES